MILKVSPQGQVTIPKAFRQTLGQPRAMEARIERSMLVLRPLIAESLAEAERMFRGDGITLEVLTEAVRIVDAKRARASG